MKVFGRGGLFNVTQRSQANGSNNVHVIEGDIEVKRNGEQNVDIYKFQIESYSQKQIDYRSQKFVQGAGIMFTGDFHSGVIKIKDVDLISNNHFFNDNTKALMSAGAAPQQQHNQNQYQGYGIQQQQQQQQQQQYSAVPNVPQNQNAYAGYGQTQYNTQPNIQPNVQTHYAPPVQEQQNNAPAQNQYAQPAQNQYQPNVEQNQYATQAPQNTQAQNQYVPPTPQQSAPAFASPTQQPNNNVNQNPQQQQATQQINYADLFSSNKS